MRLELSLIGMVRVFGAPCICRGALQSLTNATILPHLLSGLPHWSATKSNSWNAFDLEISILLPNSQASFLTIGIHPKYFYLDVFTKYFGNKLLGYVIYIFGD